MNKYQEALNRITKTAVKNETLQSDLECFYKLQELVNKETPMKPFKETQDISGRPLKTEANLLTRLHYSCPSCRVSQKDFYPYSFCAKCGQKIDWSNI